MVLSQLGESARNHTIQKAVDVMTQFDNHPYAFQHGADFSVKYLSSGQKGNAVIYRYAVEGGGYKVFFEMMKLLPRYEQEKLRPRDWGFGTLSDPVTGRVVWKFDTFITSVTARQFGLDGFKGDLITECGADNRTYVVCRRRPSGEIVTRFLLAHLLPQWQAVVTVSVPDIPVVESVEPVVEPSVPTVVCAPILSPRVTVPQPVERRQLIVLPTKRAVVGPATVATVSLSPTYAFGVDAEHHWFFTQVLSRM